MSGLATPSENHASVVNLPWKCQRRSIQILPGMDSLDCDICQSLSQIKKCGTSKIVDVPHWYIVYTKCGTSKKNSLEILSCLDLRVVNPYGFHVAARVHPGKPQAALRSATVASKVRADFTRRTGGSWANQFSWFIGIHRLQSILMLNSSFNS